MRYGTLTPRICLRRADDPLFVQQQLGHSYASTTSLYTSVSSDFKQRAVQQMITRRIRMEDSGG